MCGRYYIGDEEELIEIREIIHEVNNRFKDSPELMEMKLGEIYPTNVVPILTASRAMLMKWGYPRWDSKGVVINARAETVAEKPMFRSSLATRRCIVPSAGFFEWMHIDGKAKKDKYLLRSPDDPMLHMAGLYNTFRDKSGQEQLSFVIVTTSANESVLPIHDRMPVILPRGKQELWLRDDTYSRAILTETCDAKLELIAQ